MHISQISIYPVKSLKGIDLESSRVEKRGLRFDRRWMLTDRNGLFFTQRELPRMAAVSVSVSDEGLSISADGFGEITIPHYPESRLRQQVTVWQSEVEGHVYRRRFNEWFSEVLKRECRLIRMPDSTERHVSEPFDTGDDLVSFADGYPLLLIGAASLEELNRRIGLNNGAEAGKSPAFQMPMNRFRPSLVVNGSEPFAEDNWAKIRVGEAIFRIVKPCGRCVITTIDQDKGEVVGKEPLRTLATFRKAIDVRPEGYERFGHGPNSVLFGENMIPENPGVTVSVGDEVEVAEYR